MIKRVNRYSLTLFVTTVLWLWVAVASGADSDAVVIRAQGLADPRDTTISAIANRRVLQAFLAEQPTVRVEPFVMPAVEGSSLDAGPLLAIAAGMPPHAIYVNFRQSSTYIESGFLEPLEVLLARMLSENPQTRQFDDASGRWHAQPTEAEVAEALDQLKRRVPEPAWPVVYRPNDADPHGPSHVWALPYSNLVIALLYRKDLFRAAGLDPQHPPQTWEQMLEVVRLLADPERQQYGLMLSSELGYSTYSFLVSNGGRAVDQSDDGRWRAAYGSREAAEAYAFVWELIRGSSDPDGQAAGSPVRLGGGELGLLWNRGQVGMQFAYLNEQMLSAINPQLVGIAPVPIGPSSKRGSEINAQMLGVFTGGNPQQQLAVMRYLWFITGEQAQRIRTQAFVENGYGAFVSPFLLRKFGYDRILEDVPEGWQQAYETAMANGVPEPYGRNTQNVYRYLSRPIAETLELDLHKANHESRIEQIQAMLQASAREFDLKALGNISPQEMSKRRRVSGVVLSAVCLAFLLGFWHLWRSFTPPPSQVVRSGARLGLRAHWRRYRWGYLLLSPCMGLTLVWLYMPLMGGAAISVMDYQLAAPNRWVGVDNFASVLYDERFWSGFARTLWFVTLTIVLGFWPPILLALLLDEVPTRWMKYGFRTVFYLPAVISGVIIMFLWKQMYDPSPQGLLNRMLLSVNELGPTAATMLKLLIGICWVSFVGLLVGLALRLDELSRGLRLGLLGLASAVVVATAWPVLQAFGQGDGLSALASLVAGRFGMEPMGFISSPETAMLFCVLPGVWAGSGPGCLLYLAALKTVPSDIYEAAAIDGAGSWQKVAYITLPRLKFLIVIQFIAVVVASFKGGADFILAMTGGGPNDATMVLALEVLNRAFFELDFGVGAAMAWLLGAVLIAITAHQLKMLSRAEFSEAR